MQRRAFTLATGTMQQGFAGLVCLLSLLGGAWFVSAQSDPRQMSGIPRPVSDLPDGSISVRLVRDTLANNIANHPIELYVGPEVLTATSDNDGRVQFDKVSPGARIKAVAVVDGERLESQEFAAPGAGGIRLLLVATGRPQAAGSGATSVAGQVVLGRQSRLVIEPGDEVVAVYYLLEVVNARGDPVAPDKPFAVELPPGASNAFLLEGSSPLAAVSAAGLAVKGPFPPGSSAVHVGFELPAGGASLEIAQRFPAPLDEFTVIVRKTGDTTLSSPQIVKQQDMAADGRLYLAASGGPVAADAPLRLSLAGLPHRSPVPRRIALALTVAAALTGVWAAWRAPRDSGTAAAERRRLVARRERLLNELVRLEHDHRSGGMPGPRYQTRRDELVGALELVYGALDTDNGEPDPSAGAGVAA